MVARRWRVTVSEAGSAGSARQHEVDASNWVAALRDVRAQLGEDGAVPQGASCSVASDGTVTVLEPVSRRRFQLALVESPDASDTPAVTGPLPPPKAPSAARQAVAQTRGHAPQPSSTQAGRAEAHVQTARESLSQTRAYVSAAQGSPEGPAPGEPPAPRKAQRALGRTQAYSAEDLAEARADIAKAEGKRDLGEAKAFSPERMKSVPAASAAAGAKRDLSKTQAYSPEETAEARAAMARASAKRNLSRTQAYSPEQTAGARAAVAKAEAAAKAVPKSAQNPLAQTQGYAPTPPKPAARPPSEMRDPGANRKAAPPAASASTGPQARPEPQEERHLSLLITRDEDPTPDAPLTYRERAFVLPEGMRVTEAETAVRQALSDLQAELADRPRGKFVNLAVFDHAWDVEPDRPPVVTLEWRDWRGDPVVDYPGRLMRSQPAPEPAPASSGGEEADRLTQLFEELQHLHTSENGVAALRLGLQLVTQAVPCEAAAGCLYDINADELRVVAVEGRATGLRGEAYSARVGLLGRGFDGSIPLHVVDPEDDPGFDEVVDRWGVVGLRGVLVRSLQHKGVRHGALVMANREGESQTFSQGDIDLLNYVGDRLADTLTRLKRRPG